jgi:hypothetical protein
MALHGNYSVLHKSPALFIGGGIISGARSGMNKSGMMRNMGAVVGSDEASRNETRLTSIPHGSSTLGSWRYAKTDGGRHARSETSISATASGSLGRNMVGAASITISAEGTGGLIAGGVGTAGISIGASGDISAIVAAVGDATISISAEAVTGAIGWLQGEATMSIDGSLESYGIGWMVGSTAESGLSVPGIVNGVWGALQSQINAPGTAGAALMSAGSAGDPWITELPGSYQEGTAGAIVGRYMADVWRRLGLGNVQTTSKQGTVTTITDGDLTLIITEQTDGSVTVERQ